MNEVKTMAKKKKIEYNELETENENELIEEQDEPIIEEPEDVEETQELSFGDESYSRLSELAESDEWN
jgi:hypothetical protein